MDPYTTARLLLRPTSVEDAAFLYRLMNSPKWLEHIGDRKVYTTADAERYIEERILPQYHRLGYGSYVVIRQADGEKLGSCGLYDRDGLEGVDIGFAFLPEHERQGYAFEAASRLRDLAFHDFQLPFIQGITTRANVASQRLLEKLGLTFIRYTFIPDDDEELMLYRMEKSAGF